VAMLAAVVLNATGMTSLLKGANGVADRLETALLNLAKPATAPVKLQPVVMTEPSSQLPSLSGGTGWINGDPVTSESLRGKVVLIDFWTWDCINCQHTLPMCGLGHKVPAAGSGGDWRSHAGISLGETAVVG
jgi:hypothetical protein